LCEASSIIPLTCTYLTGPFTCADKAEIYRKKRMAVWIILFGKNYYIKNFEWCCKLNNIAFNTKIFNYILTGYIVAAGDYLSFS